jgi:alpha-D-ribose 1-methylphosphonate 5-triphosphate synthase subunit PhnI
MRIERRISSAFKTIPGGQILGSTSDYEQRVLDFSLLDETENERSAFVSRFEESVRGSSRQLPSAFRKVVEILREQGLVAPPSDTGAEAPADVTQETIALPAGRSARLQMLARAETGGALALAYSSMRGYGSIHPTIGELRVGWVEVRIAHPYRPGASVSLGSLRLTEVEIVASMERAPDAEKPTLTLGYGACFGHNEVKAISMAVLDRTMQTERPGAPAEDQEFVLLHTDGIESSGFCSHFKLPHYVTFQSDLDRVRAVQGRSPASGDDK